jgi:hypothetical protein
MPDKQQINLCKRAQEMLQVRTKAGRGGEKRLDSPNGGWLAAGVNRKEIEREKKKAADVEELVTFLVRHANRHEYCLRLTGAPFTDFVVKPLLNEVDEQDLRWMRVDLSDKSVNAVRLQRTCGTPSLHRMLTQLHVPHEYDEEGTKELRLSLRHARKLEEAGLRLSQEYRKLRWKDRMEAAAEAMQTSPHSRS